MNIPLEVAKRLCWAFVKDVCRYLRLDSYSIRLIFAPKIDPLYGIPQGVTVLEDDTIVVSEEFLSKLCHNGFTPLRADIYSHVRFISLRRLRNGNLTWEEEILDGLAYSNALLFLKGDQLPNPFPIPADETYKSSLEILEKEFHLHCHIFEMPTIPANGYPFYKIRLNGEDTKSYIRKFQRRQDFTGKCPKKGKKGSLDDPFDDVYDAIKYLRQAEEKAYDKDSLLNDIANIPYFYDQNQGMFRISWASSYVAEQRNDFPPNSFIMSQMAPMDPTRPNEFYFCLKPNLYKHKFLYRGQSDYYPGKPCVPNLFRDKEHNKESYYLDFLIFSQEMEILINSFPIVQLLDQGIELLRDKFKIRMHYSGLAQHYYNKSVFLDFTSDIDVMKFFATTDYDRKLDEYIPCIDESKIGVIYYYELRFPDAFQEHRGYALKNIGKQVFSRSGLQSGFLLQMDKGIDLKRDIPEVKAVYFRQDAKISNEIFKESHRGQDYFPEDLLQHAWQDRFKKRFEDRVVSRKAVQLNVSRNPGETEETITKKLQDRGISVDDYEPRFSEEELDNFYSNIREWWYNFCSDIHFADAEDEVYRQLMKDAIDDPKYAWAFKR